jgi:hypothetical protein
MIKKIAIGIFVIVFTIFALDYFKLLPNNKTLSFNHISHRQEAAIESFSVIEKPQQSDKFTDRVSKKPITY